MEKDGDCKSDAKKRPGLLDTGASTVSKSFGSIGCICDQCGVADQ
jgi:hypothetical protein